MLSITHRVLVWVDWRRNSIYQFHPKCQSLKYKTIVIIIISAFICLIRRWGICRWRSTKLSEWKTCSMVSPAIVSAEGQRSSPLPPHSRRTPDNWSLWDDTETVPWHGTRPNCYHAPEHCGYVLALHEWTTIMISRETPREECSSKEDATQLQRLKTHDNRRAQSTKTIKTAVV